MSLQTLLIRAGLVIGMLVAAFISGCIEGRGQVQDKWDADKAVRLQAALTAEQSARIKEQSLMNKLNEAQHAATERETKLRADYDAAHRAALGLRDTIAARRRELPADPGEAGASPAAAALELLGECAGEYGALAAAADGHASDVKTLSEAWPDEPEQ